MLKETISSGDWKGEKHVPVIEILEKGETMKVEVTVGKEIKHPNTQEHHIAWIELYFKPEDSKFPVMIGRAEFTVHNEDMATEPVAQFSLKADRKGKLMALSYCNIHGLWESEKEIGE